MNFQRFADVCVILQIFADFFGFLQDSADFSANDLIEFKMNLIDDFSPQIHGILPGFREIPEIIGVAFVVAAIF